MPRTAAYKRIADEIRSCIASGQIRPGDQLPSIAQLSEVYGVSVQPVKYALLVLQTEGLVEGQQGRGVFVLGR